MSQIQAQMEVKVTPSGTVTLIHMKANDVIIYLDGVFDGLQVSIQRQRKDGTFKQITDGLVTAETEKLVQLYTGAKVQLVYSNMGANTDVDLTAFYRY